jgi:hypothetical protein
VNYTTPRAWIARILGTLRDRGWRLGDWTAIAIVREVEITGVFDSEAARTLIDPDFLAANEIDVDDVLAHLTDVLAGWRLELPAPFLIPVEGIDSFADAAEIAPAAVADIASPLDLPEDTVKRMILRILGDGHVATDWGGERDDIHTALAMLQGRRVRASFLLKGNGLRGPLKPKSLGKNGDQLTRLITQPAELFVVQHVGLVDASTAEQLKRGIQALRFEGNERAVGSVWDGTDCARLFAAHGLLNFHTGIPTEVFT